MASKISTSYYVLFDGKCAMCSRFLYLLDKAGVNDSTRIAATSNVSKFQELSQTQEHSTTIEKLSNNTIIICSSLNPNRLIIKSRAISQLLKCTRSRRFRLAGYLIDLTHELIADFAYDIISKVRKKILGTSCIFHKPICIEIYE